ncbi:efflux RND transporter periplasmic adaptor subunit [Nocardioides montaniterrae]
MRIPVPPRLLRRLRRRTVLIGLVLVVAVAATATWLLVRSPEQAAAATSTATVSRGTVKQTVAASGTVAAARSADEDFAVAGTLTHVYVDEGDRVRKGQRLAAVDDTSLQATRAAAASQLEAAETQLDEDRDDDADDVQIASDEASVASARAALTEADDDLDDAVLRASIGGTITSVGIAVGDAVGGSSGAGGDSATSTAISIVAGGSYVVDAELSASDVGRVKAGMQATISVTGVDDTVYGTVEEVSRVAEANDSGAAVFPVTIAVTGIRKDLFAGASADATITIRVREDVLTVDTRAVRSDADGSYVERMVDGKAVRTAVTIGQTYGLQTEVRSGLKVGDEVQVVSFRAPSGGTPDLSDLQQLRQQMGSGGVPAGGVQSFQMGPAQ